MTNWRPTAKDRKAIRQAVKSPKAPDFVRCRKQRNVEGKAPRFLREEFWWAMMDCLLTTRQKSGKGSPVYTFSHDCKPYALALRKLPDREVEQFVGRTLRAHGGIRFVPTIAKRAKVNLEWLESGGWVCVEKEFRALAAQRSQIPDLCHVLREREAARYVAKALEGFGPKQSRNLWQLLGLTRYETPIDGRVTNWVNKKRLSVSIDSKKLSSVSYYESILDYLQAICHKAGVLPCVFDAAAFAEGNSDTK